MQGGRAELKRKLYSFVSGGGGHTAVPAPRPAKVPQRNRGRLLAALARNAGPALEATAQVRRQTPNTSAVTRAWSVLWSGSDALIHDHSSVSEI